MVELHELKSGDCSRSSNTGICFWPKITLLKVLCGNANCHD